LLDPLLLRLVDVLTIPLRQNWAGSNSGEVAVFETLKPLPPDAILGIMTLFRADPHQGKIDLSVGVYQDEQGRTPVLASVKRAEKAIIEAGITAAKNA
jgi:hypothetical protein